MYNGLPSSLAAIPMVYFPILLTIHPFSTTPLAPTTTRLALSITYPTAESSTTVVGMLAPA